MPAPELPIRLLALDIDGTLVGDDLILRERTRSAVREAVGRGVAVSLATGRMATSAMVFAHELRLTQPIIAYQGALIRAMPTGRDRRGETPVVGRLLRHHPLAADAARDAIAWTRRHGLDPHVNHLERFVIRADDPRAEDYSAFLGGRSTLVPDLIDWVRRPVSKIIAVSEDPIPTAILDQARAAFAGRASVTISHPRFLEFLAVGVSKGAAVRWLARHLGIPLSRTMAIGDQFNDLEMLAEVGHGAAMPSAPEPVRRAARYVAPPLGEEGAAQLIEALVLASPRRAAEHAGRLSAEHAERKPTQRRGRDSPVADAARLRVAAGRP